MTEIRETYAAWKARILEIEPEAGITTHSVGHEVKYAHASKPDSYGLVFDSWPPRAIDAEAA